MKKSLISFLLYTVFLALSSAFSQTPAPIRATFILHSPQLSSGSSVYITGGMDSLGNWDPGKAKMESYRAQSWIKTISSTAPFSVEYKYTLGSWEREGANDSGRPLSNFSVAVSHDTTINDAIKNWTKNAQPKIIHGQITGTVRYHNGMKGEGLKDRDLIIWLPPGYEKNRKARYPVVYMHDGQNIIDPATSSFGVDWQVDESCDSLIKAKAIPPVIVVGVYNTPDRGDEYSPGVKGTAYMNFMVKVVKPFIDSAYRTKKEAKYTVNGGSSSGGLIAFMLTWEHPDVFSKAVCMSPALKIEDLDYVKNVTASKGKKKLFLYMDIGGVGLETRLAPGVDDMAVALKAKGYKEGKDYEVVHDPPAVHSEASWGKRFPKAIVDCFRRK